jgi:hypothetical protein
MLTKRSAQLLVKRSGQTRFFYHYNKQTKRMTVHYQGKCLPADDLAIMVPAESKFSKRQPRVVMQGWASTVRAVPISNGWTRVEVW